MGAKAIWHGFKNTVFGRYDDDKFWRRRHALLTGRAVYLCTTLDFPLC